MIFLSFSLFVGNQGFDGRINLTGALAVLELLIQGIVDTLLGLVLADEFYHLRDDGLICKDLFYG